MTGRVLVTGGAGYIGSHTCKRLASAGYEPVVYDSLVTGHADAVRWGPLVVGDIRDTGAVVAALAKYRATAVIHFAASAYVGESVSYPGKYYSNNVAGTLSVLDACVQGEVDKLVFSSSCATYGQPTALPITEKTQQAPVNPYGRTKLVGEWMLSDFAQAHGLRFVALRYFNASGADLDGELSERHDPETHLVPRAILAAQGRIESLSVFGHDYPTADGTCIRDYIHVSDLATAHFLALEHLRKGGLNLALNVGSGKGTSVREIVESVERHTGTAVPLNYEQRRTGDPAELVADLTLATASIGFTPQHSQIDTIVRTAAFAGETR